jgi:hypothetical protein
MADWGLKDQKTHLAKTYATMIREALATNLAIDGEKHERFAALITAYTSADRLLTLLLTDRLTWMTLPLQGHKDMDAVLDVIARFGLNDKIDLAESLGVFTGPPLGALRRLNEVRNRLLHAKRKSLDLGDVAEVQKPGALTPERATQSRRLMHSVASWRSREADYWIL